VKQDECKSAAAKAEAIELNPPTWGGVPAKHDLPGCKAAMRFAGQDPAVALTGEGARACVS
jgi:hypothetical protein